MIDLDAVRERARPHFEAAGPAHDWRHVERVERLAERLVGPGADRAVVLAAVYLHDVGREREARGEIDDHAAWGAARAREVLSATGACGGETDAVAHCVRAHRYSTGPDPDSREARLLGDADNLDAMGAVGIGRCFAHGGSEGFPMHGAVDDPEAGQLAHLRSKLLSLRERMYTDAGRALAERRHAVLEEFAATFEAELAGER
ncbi:phosphohydrolase [Halobacteriales archaeon QS_5_70_17]|nr:MAG: phosphohydrolase [Halobacteriales archaeon QS_5_70_17]